MYKYIIHDIVKKIWNQQGRGGGRGGRGIGGRGGPGKLDLTGGETLLVHPCRSFLSHLFNKVEAKPDVVWAAEELLVVAQEEEINLSDDMIVRLIAYLH